MRRTLHGLFSILFPDDCRLCKQPLEEYTRVPVCPACLRSPQPLTAEYFCIQCRTPFENPYPLDDHGLCGLCRAGLSGFDAAYSFGSYEGPLRELIHLFKFSGMTPLSRPLGELLSRALPRSERFDAIVPAPLHWRRRLQRGYNQSELLARDLSRRTGIPVRRLLRRSKAAPAQASLTLAKRRRNVAGVFASSGRADGLRLLLIDDVLTTGATLAACARALKRAGAESVSALTLARTDRRAGAPGPQSFVQGAS